MSEFVPWPWKALSHSRLEIAEPDKENSSLYRGVDIEDPRRTSVV